MIKKREKNNSWYPREIKRASVRGQGIKIANEVVRVGLTEERRM